MTPPSISVIVASGGRPSLRGTLASVSPQLRPGDELLVDVNDDCPWGHEARNRMMPRARANALMFLDDDDLFVGNAMEVARQALAEEPDRMHIFRMVYLGGAYLWKNPVVICGNVSTQMFAVPNRPMSLPKWGDRYEGDFDFIQAAAKTFGVRWHEEVITLYNQSTG